jgi:hypothetical protein
MKTLLTASLVICVGSLFAVTAYAGPGVFAFHSRDTGIGIGADGCANVSGGFRCTLVSAQEYYDVKGTYEYSELYVQEQTYLATGSGFRSLRCPIERGLVKVLGGAHAASFETAVDLDTAGCDLWGYWYDSASGMTTPDGFSGIVHVLADITGRHKWTTENRSGKQTYKDTYVESYVCSSDSGIGFEEARVEINGVALEGSFMATAYRDSCQSSYRDR